MSGLHFKGKKAQDLAAKMSKRRMDNMLLDFADALADECSPAEAAFRAGAKRTDGSELLTRLRKRIGLYQAR